MSDLMLPGPTEPDPAPSVGKKSQGQRQKNSSAGCGRSDRGPKAAIPSVDDCLQGIARLPGLIALGLLKPAQANAIRANFHEILQHHKAQAKAAEKNISNSDVMDLLRRDPKLLSLLEPLLTDEQVNMVLKNATDGDDAKA